MTKFISWNVNGLRAVMKKGFLDTFNALDADLFCLQETKLQEGQIDIDLPGLRNSIGTTPTAKATAARRFSPASNPCPSVTAWIRTNTITKDV